MGSRPLRMGYVVRMFPRLSETFVLQEILELERQGVEVIIFSLKRPDEGRFHPALSRLKAPIVFLDGHEPRKCWSWLADYWPSLSEHAPNLWRLIESALPARSNSLVDSIFTAAVLAAKAKEAGIDALHAHFATAACSAAYYANQISGIPYSFTAHAKDIFVNTVDDQLLAAKIEASRFMVTVSGYNSLYLTGRFTTVDSSKIRVLYNGVDLDYFSPNGRGAQDDPPVILGVGRLVAKKGFGELLTACALLKERGVPFRCRIVGKGRENAPLQAQAASLGIADDVAFLGALHQDEVRALMRTASVFCLPCLRAEDGNQDALPTVLLESLAIGLPIVSTRLAGIPEIVDSDVDGLLVEPSDPVSLADALENVLAQQELRARFAAAGRQKAEKRFDIRRNVGTLRSWFLEEDSTETSDVSPQLSVSASPSTKECG